MYNISCKFKCILLKSVTDNFTVGFSNIEFDNTSLDLRNSMSLNFYFDLWHHLHRNRGRFQSTFLFIHGPVNLWMVRPLCNWEFICAACNTEQLSNFDSDNNNTNMSVIMILIFISISIFISTCALYIYIYIYRYMALVCSTRTACLRLYEIIKWN